MSWRCNTRTALELERVKIKALNFVQTCSDSETGAFDVHFPWFPLGRGSMWCQALNSVWPLLHPARLPRSFGRRSMAWWGWRWPCAKAQPWAPQSRSSSLANWARVTNGWVMFFRISEYFWESLDVVFLKSSCRKACHSSCDCWTQSSWWSNGAWLKPAKFHCRL